MSPFPEGKEGVQYSHVRGRWQVLYSLSMPRTLSECCLSLHTTPGQTGTDLNPTENAFGGDPEKMSNEGHVLSLIGHLRTQTPQVGTPDAAPAENQRFSPGDPDLPRPRCVPTRSCFGIT